MFSIKQKQLAKYILIGLIFCLSLAFFNSTKVIPSTVHAAGFKCDTNSVACCQVTQGKPDIEACKDSYLVVDNQDKNKTPEIGHCYTVKDTSSPGNPGFGILYYNATCSDAPFNAYQTAQIDCSPTKNADGTDGEVNSSNCGIVRYIVKAINLLSALVGLVIITVIVVSGIQFSAAGSDPQKVASARGHIVNAILALIIFIFMYAFLQWVVPGGIF